MQPFTCSPETARKNYRKTNASSPCVVTLQINGYHCRGLSMNFPKETLFRTTLRWEFLQ